MNADGTITLETRVDTKGIKTSEAEINRAADNAGKKFKDIGVTLSKALAGGGTKEAQLAVSFQKATAEVEKQSAKVEELKQKMAGLKSGEITVKDSGAAKLQTDFDKASAGIAKTKSEINQLYMQLDTLQSNAFKGPAGNIILTGEQQAEFDKLNAKLSELEPKLEQDRKKAQELGAALKKAAGAATQAEISKTSARLSEAENKLSGLSAKAQITGQKMQSEMNKTRNPINAVSTGFATAGRKLLQLAKGALVFSLITRGFTVLRQTLGSALMSNEGFRQSLDRLQAAFWTAFAPIYNYVLPALQTLINWITSAITSVLKLFAALTGKSYSAMVDSGKKLQNQTAAYNSGSGKSKSGAGGGKSAEEKAIEDQIKALQKKNKELQKQQKEADKERKKQEAANKKSLAGFDELNILSEQKNQEDEDAFETEIDKNNEIIDQLQEQLALLQEKKSYGADASDTGGGGIDKGFSSLSVDAIKFDTSQLDFVKERIKNISDIFMSGFWEGFANADFSEVKNNVSEIGREIGSLFSADEVQTSVQNYLISLITAFGQISGSIASIGCTIAQNLTGGFSQYLSENSETIKKHITSIFNIKSEILSIVGEWAISIADIFSVFGDKHGQEITANILGVFSELTFGITEIAYSLARDFITFLAQPIIDNKEEIKVALDGILEIFANITEDIKSIVDTLVQGILSLYDEHLKPLWNTLTSTLSEWVGNVVEKWNTVIKPVLDEFAGKFHEVVETHVKPMIDNLINFFGSVADELSVLIDNFVRPLGNEIIDVIMPAIGSVIDSLGETFNTLLATVSYVISNITDILNGILTFLSGVFTGDWGKIWKGLGEIVKGAVNLVITLFEGAVNLIVTGLNSLLAPINNIASSLGDAIGIDINIPKIPKINLPRLARGTVVPQNREFLALLGDNKNEPEIVSPLSTMEQAVENVLARQGYFGGNQTIILELDGREVGRTFGKAIQNEARRTGSNFVKPKIVFG